MDIDIEYRNYDITNIEGRLALYKEMLIDWSKPYEINSFTYVGFCEYLYRWYGIVTTGEGIFGQILPELWYFRTNDKFYYWSGKGVDLKGRTERINALIKAIKLCKEEKNIGQNN